MRYLGWLPDRIAGYHKIRNRLSRYVAKSKGYTGYFQLYSVPFRYLPWLDYTGEKRHLRARRNHRRTSLDLRDMESLRQAWNRSDWRNGDDKNYAEAEQLIAKGEVELVYLFTAGLDAVMHRYGPWSPEARSAIQGFEGRIEQLMALAESKYSDVRLAIFSDHGMAEVQQTSDLRLRCERLPLKYGTDYVAVWDSTMARFWFKNNDKAKQTITDLLHSATEGQIVPPDTLQKWRCDFPDHAYGNSSTSSIPESSSSPPF